MAPQNGGTSSPGSGATPQTSISTPTSTSISLVTSSANPASMSASPATTCTDTGTSSSSGNLSNGAVAGVVIGCALALSLLTFCSTYLWMRRRNNRREDSRDGRHGSLRTSSRRSSRKDAETKQPIVTEEMSSIGARSPIQEYIPRAADDKTVHNKVFGLLDNIAVHVENFYRNISPTVPAESVAQLGQLNSSHLPESIVAMLQRSSHPDTLITHCLTELIIAAIMPSREPTQSLLPMQFTALPSTGSSRRSRERDSDRALFLWRMLSVYLHPNIALDSAYTSHRKDLIARNVQSFTLAFSPWRNPNHSREECVQSLTIIMESAAETGIWLFSQPCKFEFYWRSPADGNAKKIEKSPELIKVGDESGIMLEEAQIIVGSVVGKV